MTSSRYALLRSSAAYVHELQQVRLSVSGSLSLLGENDDHARRQIGFVREQSLSSGKYIH